MQLECSANLLQMCDDRQTGFNNDTILGNIEVKTTSPLCSSADRSVDKDEETLKSDSSSGGSSPSDLKERLLQFSSPKETTRIISRRLSQRQDLYFGAAEIIDESEEKEEQESTSCAVQIRGARARRRAKLRLQDQTMVVTKPTESGVIEAKSDPNDNQRSDRNSMIGSRSPQTEQPASVAESLNSPLSGRTSTSMSSCHNKCNGSYDSSRSQRNSSLLHKNSPKHKIDLQPLSPASLGSARPTRFGGYRPQAGVILQNLSSSSEQGSGHEDTHKKKIASPTNCVSSSRRSSAIRKNSKPKKNEVSTEINLLQGSDDSSLSTPLSPLTTLHDSAFCRMMDSSRNIRSTFKDSARVELSWTKEEIEELGKPINQTCVDPSGWKEARTTPVTASSVFRNPLEEQPEQSRTEDTETSSTASGFKVLFDELKTTFPSEIYSNTISGQNFTNVPTLALNSQEMSYIASPAAKASPERHLDTDALIAALSNVSLKQQNAISANVCSERSSSRFNGSDTSYGSSYGRRSKTEERRSKIPVKIPTTRTKSHISLRQNTSVSLERLKDSFSAKNNKDSNLDNLQVNSDRSRKSSSSAKNYAAGNFDDSQSPTSDWSTKATSRDQSKHFGSENSDRMSLGLKDVRSKSCFTPLQILSNEETQNEIYTVNSNNSKNYDSLIDPQNINSSINQQEHQRNDDGSWKSDLADHKSLSPSISHQTRYTNTYNEQVCEGTELKNQMGDTGCQATFTDSSSEDEELKKIRHRNKLRFSLEKLAADQLRKSIYPEQTEIDAVTFLKEKQHSTSTSQIRQICEKTRDSPRIKKSQDRFPFTISEKPSASSMKYKHPVKLPNLKSDRSYKLTTHPSITRLAGSGYEDKPADIIDYVTRIERVNNEVKSFGVRGLVQKFSARLKRSKKCDQVRPETKIADVIYQNHAYREEYDSLAASCSESSLLKDLKTHESAGEQGHTGADSPDEKSSAISDKKSPQHPYRRYDRDDLWVRTSEKPEVERQKEDASKELDECKSPRDPYSVFFVKRIRETTREFLPEHEEDTVKFSGSLSDKDISARKFENKKNRNVGNGCFCLRFYRMIVPVSFGSVSKHLSRDNRISIKKKSHFFLQRKKG